MPKRISPSITAIKREVNGDIREIFQKLVEEFPGHFDTQEASTHVAVFLAAAAHHPQEAIISAFPSVADEEGIRHCISEAHKWMGDRHLGMAMLGSARALNIPPENLGKEDPGLG